MVFYSLQDTTFNNALYFIKYLLIGLGMGILVGIIVFKSLKKHVITPGHEIGLIAVAIAVYIITEQLAGSGLFAVMILGIFFGNSYVRKTAQMHSFSPYIFKSLEMLIYLMIGLVIPIIFSGRLLLQALLIFIIYLVLRFIIIYLHYRHHSMQNKLLLTLAPKGMIVGIMILVLGAYGSIENILLNTMLIILAYSLIVGIIIEYLEQKKMLRLDRIFKVLLNIRYGRKKDLKKNRHIHT
jgi:NhaP-type Na+/H+ and K+/H+ antiporter